VLAADPDLGLSRAALKRLADEGRVAVDGRPARAGTRVRGGEAVTVRLHPPVPEHPQPQAMDLATVHVDPHLVVVDKPPGLVVHPAAGHPDGTLVNGLLHSFGSLPATDDPCRPGIVHRLDRDTSGLLVVARTPETLASLQAQIGARTARRSYVTLVRSAARLPDAGEWDTPYGRHPKDRKRFSSRVEAERRAVTRWRVVERLGGLALCEVSLVTGRTHQIRVHFADAGHPVCGDRVYGGRGRRGRPAEERAALAGLGRQFLHATRLELTHPATGARTTLSSALAPDLAAVLEAVRDALGGALRPATPPPRTGSGCPS